MTSKRKKGILASFLAGAMALVGCSQGEMNDEVRTPPKELPIATIVIKNYGTIEAELYPHIAPNTVNNFISLANSGFYDGLTFHRIIKDFMIQGGDPNGNGSGGPGYSIKGEFTKNKFKNDLKHTEGVLSMARSQNKNSGGSQFFIMTKDSPHLDGQYAAFGKIIKGIDIVHEIENTKTGNNDKPEKDIVIESIKVDTKGIKYDAPEKI
ncbi:Putative peptidyl-prolyl cis-trans isomerase [Terrisporobacter petrolearius]|uniref:Peptidyl-prolyl cis-trans isomerase n=2 Tax=Peptostreptococcaceae TaxID=186804 RepID=A0AAX2ZBU0_9FIRM|nr:peptidylprolyl isomerase [Terrisporobacter glycolicus]UEL46704.1 peptidylprolyl isomerase [Terrisporobacter hibernicus]